MQRYTNFVNMSTIGERIFEVKNHFFGDDRGSNKKFADAIGVNPNVVSNWFARKDGIGNAVIEKILEAFPGVNKGWLVGGNGSMLNKGGDPNGKPEEKPATRYYPNVTGTMGSVEFLDNPDETWLPISVPGFERCEFAIPAYGDSMTPTITSGHIILLSPWRESYLEWGKIYLVITSQGHRSVKRLFPADTDDSVTCKSDNPAYPPYQVRREDITRLYLVQGWICRDSI